jgi:hypothetical protein
VEHTCNPQLPGRQRKEDREFEATPGKLRETLSQNKAQKGLEARLKCKVLGSIPILHIHVHNYTDDSKNYVFHKHRMHISIHSNYLLITYNVQGII